MDLMILWLNKGDGSDIIDNRSIKLINLNNFFNKGDILLEKAYVVYIAVHEIATNLFSVYDLDIAKCRKWYIMKRKEKSVSGKSIEEIKEIENAMGRE